jgi:predicted patatin/cPLA2 family phospholipase
MWSLILIVFSSYAVAASRCRAVAFAGGCDKGPYEAGVLLGLVKNLPLGSAEYDVVTGISVGAINALVLSRFPKGQELEAANYLVNFWKDFKYYQFYSDWWGGLVEGLFIKSGLYNSAPMNATLYEKLLVNERFERMLVVGTTNLVDGMFYTFNSTLSLDKVLTGVLASASMSGVFPVVNYGTMDLIDGSIKFAVDIISAVNQCQSKGFDYKLIDVDVIMCNAKSLQTISADSYNSLQTLLRYLAITSYNNIMQVVSNARHFYPDVNIRTVVSPSSNIESFFQIYPYDFSSSEIANMLAVGEKDGKAAAQKVLLKEMGEIIVDY